MMVLGSTTRLRLLRRAAPGTLAIAVLMGSMAVVYACNVPVFRYALERWRPDPYRLTLFHRGSLSAAEQALIKPWEEPAGPGFNGALRLVDVDAIESEADRELFVQQSSDKLPLLALQYPQGLKIPTTIWADKLSAESMSRLRASPLRTELVRRLVAGETAVWLLLESGNAKADDAAAAMLESELKQLAGKLKLPELTASPDDQLLSNAPLKVGFSMIRVPRNVPAEQPLVQQLLHIESDLVELSKPMIYPVFGRGRALLPLIGAGITPENIHESAAFLVGACSCEVKELNPGFDLLLAADWDELLSTPIPAEGLGSGAAATPPGKPELIAIPPGAPAAVPHPPNPTIAAAAPSPEPSSSTPNYLFVLLGIGVLTGVLVVVLRR